MISGLDGAFDAVAPIDHPLIAYRGTGDADKILGPVGSNVGGTFTNKAYTSTTTREHAKSGYGYGYESKDAIFEITLPKGSKALKGNAHERELILPRDAVFRVNEDTVGSDGIRRAKLTYLPDEKPEHTSDENLSTPISTPSEEKKPLTVAMPLSSSGKISTEDVHVPKSGGVVTHKQTGETYG